jgi:hypothetical protein
MAETQLDSRIPNPESRSSLLGAALLLLLGCSSTEGAPQGQPATLKLAVFASDVTPPIGHPLMGGWTKPVAVISQPLMLKGVVLDDGKTRTILAAMDWCVLRGAAFDLFREKLARAAGIPPSRVALHMTHTHTAPVVDLLAQKLIAATEQPPPHVDLEWLDRVVDEAARAVETSLHHLQPFTHVGVGQARVEQFASTRRIPGPDGKIKVRFSTTKDESIREAPEGRIDPWLKTVTLYDGEIPLVRLHYYASHPQTSFPGGEVHPDTPAMARSYLEAEEGVAQIYFTGCGGDVTAGKYNDGTPAARVALSKQLYSGMIRSIAATRRVPAAGFSWSTSDVRFAPRQEPQFSEATLRRVMADPAATASKRLHAALAVSWIERLKSRPAVEISRLRIGPADLLHLPGEPFVEYQLHAQAARPDRFVAVAGYGDGGPGYICTDAALGEGGYEPTASFVGPPSEALLKAAIEGLLK